VKIVYSIDAKLGGGGIGATAHQAALGIYRAGALERIFVSSIAQTEIPTKLIHRLGFVGRVIKYAGAKDPSGLIYSLEGDAFDRWVASQMPRGDIFHGWNGMCLRSLRTAKQRGMITVVERASSHPETQLRLSQEEHRRWGLTDYRAAPNYARCARELDEADYIAIPSAFVRDSMIAAGVPETKLFEIPFGVDLIQFFPSPSPERRPFRAIFVGQVSIRKGLPHLLEAWRMLRWSDAELWIVGTVRPDFAPLRSRWSELKSVRYIPHAAAVAPLLQQCDVFVFPSIEEGSALVTYEAMACGLPIITTPNAGSVARDGVDGYVVPIRDVDALRDRLERLRGDAALRRQMGQSARQRAEQFAWTRYQSALITSYHRLTGE